MSNPTAEKDVEYELFLDRLLYGTSFHKIVDGQKVRIAPMDVYLRPRWWVRLGYWLRWNLWRRWL